MRVRTFRDKSMARVLARIKSEMGPDAVILSNQTVRENGQCLCEIMAAVESDEQAQPAPAKDKVVPIPQAAPKAPSPKGRTRAARPEAEAVPEIAIPAPSGDDWRREWDTIRDHMLALIKPGLEFDRLEPRQRLALQYLEREGVDDAVLLTLFKSLAERGERTVLTALSRMVGVRPLPSAQWPQRIHVLAGPSGAGKTTAALRLALARKRLSPNTPVTVVALWDAASGTSLLKRYAELSGLAFRAVSSPEEFRELCGHLGKTGWAFAEMPCLRGEETMDGRLRAMGMAGHPDVAVHLVLSPTCATAQLRAYAARHKAAAPGSIVWTKLDEACNFGALINVAHAVGLPVSALSHGPELTRNLSMATANEVWKLIFKHQLPGEAAREPQAAPGRGKSAPAAKSAA
jgi:flagellar biosynthesis protein FlhF